MFFLTLTTAYREMGNLSGRKGGERADHERDDELSICREAAHSTGVQKRERQGVKEKKIKSIFDQSPTNPVVRSLLTELSLP